MRQCWTVHSCQTTSGNVTILFIFIDRMIFQAPTLDNADPLLVAVITPGFYVRHIEVADQDPASGSP